MISCGSDDGSGPPDASAPEDGVPDVQGLDVGIDAPPQPAKFGLDARPSNTTCKAPARPPTSGAINFQRVFSNVVLNNPIVMAQMPGDSSRWFVAEHGTVEGGFGNIVSFPVVSPPNTPTVVGSVGPLRATDSEGGFLGMAFHPKCSPTSCRLYVTYVGDGATFYTNSRVAYLTSTDNGATFTGLTDILVFEDSPAVSHRGSAAAFGPDGYLYVGFGDHSGGDDGYELTQKTDKLSGKIIRIDVDNVPVGKTYGIPPDNPYANGGGDPAIFALGLRQPFRMTFDRASGDLWVGDVGQLDWEEVDIVKLGGNYGWPCREGFHDHVTPAVDPIRCPSMAGIIDPIVEHAHNGNGRCITGGVVYRGKAIPSLLGTYVYGEFCTQEIFTLTFDPTTGKPVSTLVPDTPQISWVEFAQDNDGEIYGVDFLNGTLSKLVATGPQPTSTFPDRLSKTGCSDPSDAKKPASGLVPYGVSSELWSDGASKERFMALPDGKTIAVGADGDFDLPIGSVLEKSFAVDGKRIETRLLVRHDDGGWAGYSYEWLDDGSDAVLLPAGKTKKLAGGKTWTFPSRGECMRCHTEAAGRTLGLELGQLNGAFTYASTNRIANQLDTLEHIGMFGAPLGKPVADLPVYPGLDSTASAEARARAYLHSNCSMCHRPNGGDAGPMDLRFSNAFSATKTCNVAAVGGDRGIAGAKLIVPGDPAKSLVSVRPHAASGVMRMPPLATNVVDTKGVGVLDSWIKSVTACP